MSFPAKETEAAIAREADAKPQAAAEPGETSAPATADRAAWVPVLGRSAAGVAQFWSDAKAARGVTQLADLIARQGRREQTQPMNVSTADGAAQGPVWLVTLSAPDADDVVEFLAAPALKARHADAFALRLDGRHSPRRPGDSLALGARPGWASRRRPTRRADRRHLQALPPRRPDRSPPAHQRSGSLADLPRR